MTFEPLIHVAPPLVVFQGILWSLLISAITCGMTYTVLHFIKRTEDLVAACFATVAMTVLFGTVLVGFAIQGNQISANEAIVFSNVSKKYQVDAIGFNPVKSKYRSYYPEQPEPQPLTVKTHGESRQVILTQNIDTSEPTLTDANTGKPLEDLRRKQ